MASHKFRMGDMMPNAWFYKLKNMSKGEKKADPPPAPEVQQHYQPGRSSNYIPSSPTISRAASETRLPLKTPRKSKKSHGKPPGRLVSTIAGDIDGEEAFFSDEQIISESCDRCCSGGRPTGEEYKDLEPSSPTVHLPPILTKPPREEDETKISSPSFRRHSERVQGIRIRQNSPRMAMANKKVPVGRRKPAVTSRKCLSQSFAVVKFSSDPQRDFRESMEEMIQENDIRSSKDLEDLLACYLSLNAGEYHGTIVRAFEQIWSDLADHRRHESRKPRHCR